MLETYYFTFGFGQVYENCFHKIKAKNNVEARKQMVEKFGFLWAFQYNEKEWNQDGISQQKQFELKEIK